MLEWLFCSVGSRRRIQEKRQRQAFIISKTRTKLLDIPAPRYEGTFPDLEELVGLVKSGKLSSLQLTKELGLRALEAQLKYKPLTEIFILGALENALVSDRSLHQQEQGKDGVDLLGIPFSVKDSIDIAGYDTSLGYSSFTKRAALKDALFVQHMKQLGAFPFCKTNVPQTLLSFECSNPLWGTSTNPYNSKLTPGGSSGGEAALIAAGASVIGFGTDVGGSIRIPAHFCGIYALKPSHGRLSYKGISVITPGSDTVPVVVGPMGRSVKDLTYVMKLLISKRPWNEDPICVPLPWTPPVLNKSLKIGYYRYDGFIPASPACQRAINETVTKLEKAGHELIPFNPPNVTEAFSVFAALAAADGGCHYTLPLKGDAMEKAVKLNLWILSLWRPVRWVLGYLLENWLKSRMDALLVKRLRGSSVLELEEWVHRRDEYKNVFFQAWNAAGIDCLICPVNALPAVQHGDSSHASAAASYTVLFNILDYPAGVIPVSKVDKELDCGSEKSWLYAKEGDVEEVEVAENQLRGVYDAAVMHGAPVGIQVVGKRLQEEKVLACMQVIDGVLSSSMAA